MIVFQDTVFDPRVSTEKCVKSFISENISINLQIYAIHPQHPHTHTHTVKLIRFSKSQIHQVSYTTNGNTSVNLNISKESLDKKQKT